jgi:transcription antitermination factor NusG
VETCFPTKEGEALSEIYTASSAGTRAASAEDPSAQWFAVYTSHRHEKHVAGLLLEREIKTLLPLYTTGRQWKKRAPVALELPLFPCYLFVNISPGARGSVLGVPGVLSIVGSPNEPWPVLACEIEALRLAIKLGAIEPHPYLKVGERVKIKNGPMAGLEGILTRKKTTLRFVLTLDVIMQSVAVEVDANNIEHVNGHEERQMGRAPLPEFCRSSWDKARLGLLVNPGRYL